MESVPRHMIHGTAKALELFLGVIVDEASKVTLERGSKKVEAYHLYVPSLVLSLPSPHSLLFRS